MQQAATPIIDGDERLFGVIMRGHPALLPPGWAAEAINYRFREGIAEPRPGFVHPPWFNRIVGTDVHCWGQVHGTGKFIDTKDRVWTLIAADGGVFACLPNNVPRSLGLPAGVVLTGEVTFEQFGSTVLLMRGTEADPLQMSVLADGFGPVPAPTVEGVDGIPRGLRAVTAGERLWIVVGDQVWASDLLDHTTYDPFNQFSITDGTADPIRQIVLFAETNIIVLKEHSVWRLTNVLGSLQQTEARRITKRYGCVAAGSVVDVGTDLIWLSEEGVASLTLTELGELQTGQGIARPPMFSDPIDPLIGRIQWAFAEQAVGAFWDGRLYMAVPLDDAEREQPELLSGVYNADIGILKGVDVIAGATYRYMPGINEDTLTNGAQLITAPMDFVASGSVVTLARDFFAPDFLVTASLKRVYKGVNSAVLVYDFKGVQPGWQGHDESSGLTPRFWLRAGYGGRDRLAFVGVDGWFSIYEEGVADILSLPYVDVKVIAAPVAGDNVQINGGASVVVIANETNAGIQKWANGLPTGPSDVADAARNLWMDANDRGGYAPYPASTGNWTAPNTAPLQLREDGVPVGVRFYSTDNVRPTVAVTGSWHEIVHVGYEAIRTLLVTRAYRTALPMPTKRTPVIAAQVQTWNPRYTVAYRPEGVNMEQPVVTDRTRSRTRYDRPAWRPAWNESNADDDFNAPGREDYSVALRPAGIALLSAFRLDFHQESQHRVRVNRRARAGQVVLENESGRLVVVGIEVKPTVNQRGEGVRHV